jgi:sec-independent protein translocase protein TatA
MTFLFLGNLGGWEMVAVVFVVLLLFGGKKIPELMRGLGAGIREFNNAKNSINNEIREGMREAERKNIPDNNSTNQ